MLRSLFCLLLLGATSAWAGDVRELTWAEMVPADAQQAPAQLIPLHSGNLADALAAESAPPVPQLSKEGPVVPALNGQQVKLPGYIVPLEVGDDGKVTQFLLVPYFGACIHVPPPPANQIVFVRYAEGVLLDALYQPFWIEGPLSTTAASSDIAEAGYSMQANRVYPYDQPDS